MERKTRGNKRFECEEAEKSAETVKCRKNPRKFTAVFNEGLSSNPLKIKCMSLFY